MKSLRTVSTAALVLMLAGGLGACSNMSQRERATATGAAVGGAVGAVVTGSTAGAVGGAVVGGVIGHELDKKNK
nr:glycine zipper domain-containing protein [uncultured Roseateles sp.]